MNPPLSRRQFLRRATAAAGTLALPSFIPGAALGQGGPATPAGRLAIGLIGKGLMGSGHLARLAGDPGVEVIGVCDPDRSRREEGLRVVAETYSASRGRPGACAGYADYRDLIARADLDAVLIASPDHWHTVQTIDAVNAGKDVYCEKPVSLTLAQGRALVEAVRRHGRVFQTGTQYRSIPAIRRVCEFIRGGGLGKVRQVFTLWQSLGGFISAPRFAPSAPAIAAAGWGASMAPLDCLLPGQPVPEGLDWDLWLGPAPWRPYNQAYHLNPSPGVVPWSFCEDFGAASVTWFHSHAADVIQYALGVENSGPVEIIHPSSGRYPTLTCRYASGTLLHVVENWGAVRKLYNAVPEGARLEGNFGGVFVGERGWLTALSAGGPLEGGPEEIFRNLGLPSREVNIGGNNHHANWFDCIRQRRAPSCHEEIGHRSASLGHLTTLAFKLGRSLKWDPALETFEGDDTANRLRSRACRAPWRL